MKMKTVYEANPALGDPMSIQVDPALGDPMSIQVEWSQLRGFWRNIMLYISYVNAVEY